MRWVMHVVKVPTLMTGTVRFGKDLHEEVPTALCEKILG
jgi:hypothetical protein